jgi:predicted Zn-dependent peptidase
MKWVRTATPETAKTAQSTTPRFFEFNSMIQLPDLMRPSLREATLNREERIVEEILMYDDQPPYGGYERAMAEYFGDHPLGQSILGTVPSVEGLTPESMREYFRRRYSPNNMAIVAAGNVDFDRLIADAERFCGGWQPEELGKNIRPAAPRTGFHRMVKPLSAQHYVLQLSSGPAADDPHDSPHGWSRHLGRREREPLVLGFIDSGRPKPLRWGIMNSKDRSVMTVLCCAPEQTQDNLIALRRLQETAMREGIQQRELDLAKSKIVSEILIASERAENRMFGVGGNWLKHRPYLPSDEVAQLFSDVTLDEVNQILRQFSLTDCTTLSVGPLTQLSMAS